ncbi:glycosyltransferase family 4 protein [Marinobacter salicampi]|uniref:glycosyltransferase family 4 protein n=1 Tax=Marinobacter salicampi TaxID=435907 RepID=UPI00140B2F87|nr:glycosyltransferase family 4 protein [Marinobacter salicampi]
MRKTVWIVNQYASTPEYGFAGRHYYLGRELAKLGYNVYLIVSAGHHLLRSKPELISEFKLEKEADRFTVVWTSMPHYDQAHSKGRAIGWFLFSWRIRKLAKVIPESPDAVVCSSPSLLSFFGAKSLARKFGARLVFDVRDIWPMTLIEIGGYSAKHPFVRFLQRVEDKAYQDSDWVISNLKNSVEHMVSRGMKREKFSWVPNGFSMDEVRMNIPLNDRADGQLPQNKFLIGYTGTLGFANALNTLINAADRLRDHPDIAFILVGNGKEKPELQELVDGKRLGNVYFVDSIPKVEVPSMLSRFNACYIGWLNDPLYRFGIGANKLPEYLYSGKPIIHAFSGACDPVGEANAGLQIAAEDDKQLADAVLKLYRSTPEERAVMGANGRKLALDQYEYRQLAEKLSKILFA